MKIENSIGPLILLLKVRRIREKAICNKYITNQMESKVIDYEFNNLVESNLLDKNFLKIQPPWFLRAVSLGKILRKTPNIRIARPQITLGIRTNAWQKEKLQKLTKVTDAGF